MKLSNRIMSWILSPGAYAVWHSMGNPEEWRWDAPSEQLIHQSGLWLPLLDKSTKEIPAVIAYPTVFVLGTFVLDCGGEYKGAIGHLERHLIAGRAYRLKNRLCRQAQLSIRKRRNQAVFTKLLVNQEAE